MASPSVVQFAQSVVSGEPIVYGGDPLRDFGLMPFLDKFVFKNPKAAKLTKPTKPAKPASSVGRRDA